MTQERLAQQDQLVTLVQQVQPARQDRKERKALQALLDPREPQVTWALPAQLEPQDQPAPSRSLLSTLRQQITRWC